MLCNSTCGVARSFDCGKGYINILYLVQKMESLGTSVRSTGVDALFQYTGTGVQLFSGMIFYYVWPSKDVFKIQEDVTYIRETIV